MLTAMWVIAALVSAAREAPSYSAPGVVNAASNQTNSYAPNTFITIYGRNLAWTERSLSAQEVSAGKLPDILPNTGVRVWIGSVAAHMYYVSPVQINVLLPANLRPGRTELRVQLDATAGPVIPITVERTAPALFQMDARMAISVHADGRLVTEDLPARPGEVISLYATGLGPTAPPAGYAEIPNTAARLADMASFGIQFDGVAVDGGRILYAGVAPGFAGLYQVNVQLPDVLGANPEVRLSAAGAISPEGIRIYVRGAE